MASDMPRKSSDTQGLETRGPKHRTNSWEHKSLQALVVDPWKPGDLSIEDVNDAKSKLSDHTIIWASSYELQQRNQTILKFNCRDGVIEFMSMQMSDPKQVMSAL